MDNEHLESFYFKEKIADTEHNYRVTMNETTYEVERDGKLIAELEHDSVWRQVSGVPLTDEAVQLIGNKIVKTLSRDFTGVTRDGG